MKIKQTRFLDFLGMPDSRFIIPAYQRLYTWSESQCEELWLDILRAGRYHRTHFLGTILYSIERDNRGEFLAIIDGQQRMTSVSLILLALARHARKHPNSFVVSDDLERRYLRVSDEESVSSPKLTLSHYDMGSYLAALEGRDPIAKTTIDRNLAYFEAKIADESFDIEELWEGLLNLVMIAVQVDDSESSQSIFESINSKGVPLNVADMIRNYLLLAENHDEQTRLYEEYWKPIQEMFAPDSGSLRLNGAIKSWISIRLKGARILSADQVYSSFKKYVEDQYRGDKEPVLRELRGFSLMWAENYRYHGTKKYKSGSAWAEIGAPTLTSGYKLKKADNEEYAERVRRELRNVDSRW
jgi:uncharacterized protein with ParB-like and HNH nuclease domain